MSNMFNPRLLNIPVLNVTRTGTHQYSLRIWLAARKNELAAMVKGLIKSNLTDIGVASKKILPQYPPPFPRRVSGKGTLPGVCGILQRRGNLSARRANIRSANSICRRIDRLRLICFSEHDLTVTPAS